MHWPQYNFIINLCNTTVKNYIVKHIVSIKFYLGFAIIKNGILTGTYQHCVLLVLVYNKYISAAIINFWHLSCLSSVGYAIF